MSVSVPISILARVTAADISPLTIVVWQEMTSLFRLSTTGHERLIRALGELKSFSAIGDAIWFGFGIKHIVEIRSAGNATIYKSTTNDDSIRLLVIYGTAQSSNQVQVNSTAYFINSVDKVMSSYKQRFDSIISGTAPWNNCLFTTFGDSFTRLLGAKQDFGRLMGAAARVFKALTNSDTSGIFDSDDCISWFGFQPGGYCLPVLAETIIFLIWNVSALQLHAGLKPYHSGLRFIYQLHAGRAMTDTSFGERVNYQASVTDTLGGNISLPILSMDTGGSDLKVKLLVEESTGGLLVDLHFLGSAGTCRVGAYTMLKEIIENSGLVQGNHCDCARIDQTSSAISIVNGEGSVPEILQPRIYLRRLAGNPLARCVGLLVNREWMDAPILCQRECLPCCIKAAADLRGDHRRSLSYVIL
ncbi:hypothetical protein LZL87_007902 [Fusarium oxysporum]|nr:hypothetical protein LZL87_007902 [Fusarium oxysporum]